jgi:predicted NAD-dependent protein-ADP-ribosyltransferase YbiA (DUF1768 family)
MATEIKIFNPASTPFGCLSNNYNQKRLGAYNVKIQNVSCVTLTNYIYANLLKENTNKLIVCRELDYKKVKEVYTQLNNTEIFNVLRDSIMEALDVMFKNSIELTNLLLSTKDSDIEYISDFLGTSSKGLDKNLYGICLKDKRQKLLIEANKKEKAKNKEKTDQLNYDIYLAYKGLTTLIENGTDIRIFLNKNIEEIIHALGRDMLESKIMSKTNFLEQYNKKNEVIMRIQELYQYPQNVVPTILKEQLPLLFEKNQRKKKKRIFYMYADYLLDRKFKNVKKENYDEAKSQHFSDPNFSKMSNDLENRLFILYEKGVLSANLCDDIDIDPEINSYNFPTKKDIDEAIKYPLSYDKKDYTDRFEKQTSDVIYVLPPSSKKLDAKYDEHLQYTVFSPMTFFKNILKIEAYNYISVIHYVIVKLLVHIGISYEDAYKHILSKGSTREKPTFINPFNVMGVYKTEKENKYKVNITKYAIEGLKIKFLDNSVLQDFLLATNNAKIIYDDNENPILRKVVGDELMRLRKEIREKRKINDKFDLLKTEDITFIFQINSFMNNWVQKRVADSCKTLTIMKEYLKNKYNKNAEITPEFAKMVIDNIYQPCSEVYGVAHKIKAKVPDYFTKIVQEKCSITPVDNKLADVIWKRLAVIIHYLIEHLKTKSTYKSITSHDISSEIVNAQELTNNIYQCEKIIIDDEYSNCIASAIINLLCGIFKFNKIYQSESIISITEFDVQAAVSIILETIIPKETVFKTEGPEEGPEEEPEEGPEEGLGDDSEDKKIKQENPELTFNYEESDEEDNESDEEDNKSDYQSDEEDNESDYEMSFSPRKDMIQTFLNTLEEFSNTDKQEMSKIIKNAIEFIKKNTSKISNKVKKNRINFFAKQR